MRRSYFRGAALLAICNVLLILVSGLANDTQSRATDFVQYYVVGERLHNGGQIYAPIVYDQRANQGESKAETPREPHRMPNPPPLAVLMWLLPVLGYSLAWWCMCLGSLLIIAGASYRVARDLFGSSLERATWVLVSLGSSPTLVNGLLNHIEPFVWAIMALGWLRLRRGDEKMAGILLGVAGSLKLFPLAMIPMFFAAGYRRASVIAAVSATVCLGVSAVIVGPETTLIFLREVLPQCSRYRHSMANVSGLSLLELLVPGEVAIFLGAVFLLWTVYLCHRLRSADKVYVLGVTAALLCSPLSWTYYFVLVLPCLMVSTTWLKEPPRIVIPLLVATLVYWPWMFGGLLAASWMPLPLLVALNYVPTLGLVVLWLTPQLSGSPTEERS